MFYATAVPAVCIIVYLRYRRCKWLTEMKLAMDTATSNRCQFAVNKRLKDRKQKLLYDELKRLHERLRENEKHQHQQQELSAVNSRLNVVEIGPGVGVNLEFYPPGVTVTYVEPNAKFEAHIRRNAQRCTDVCLGKFHVASAEDMTQCIESGSVDAVVCTFVLCSVPDVDRCLSEIVRILKPGGQFFFLEHIRADENAPDHGKLAQSILKTPWRVLFGCNMDRVSHESIHSAAFSHVDVELFDAVELVKPTPIFPVTTLVSAFRPHAMGIATK